MKRFNLHQIMNTAHALYKEGKRSGKTFADCLRQSWSMAKATTCYRIDIVTDDDDTYTYYISDAREARDAFRRLGEQLMRDTPLIKQKMYERKNGSDRKGLFFDLCGDEDNSISITMTLVHYTANTTSTSEAVRSFRSSEFKENQVRQLKRMEWRYTGYNYYYGHQTRIF